MTENLRVTIFGTAGSPLCYTIRDFLYRSDVPFDWIELKTDEQARSLANVNHLGDPRLPVCIFSDGTRSERPTVRQIVERLGWFRDPSRAEYDVAIYGAGPAGLSAAVYGASEGLKTVLIERFAVGGQAGSSSRIENYLGFPNGISGADLAERAREQACRFGAEILVGREGVRGEFVPGKSSGFLADGTKIVARATICATGVDYRRLGLPNEDRFFGAGVYYGASVSEASLCEGEHVAIAGGGNSAGQSALYFAHFALRVTMVVREPSLSISMSQYLIDQLTAHPNLEILVNSEISGLHGDDQLQEITILSHDSGKEEILKISRLVICIGGMPRTEWAKQVGIVRDSGGYLVTGPDLFHLGRPPEGWPLDRNPYYLETSLPGVFAAGDVRHGSVKRCASAVGEGAMALTFVHRYLAEG